MLVLVLAVFAAAVPAAPAGAGPATASPNLLMNQDGSGAPQNEAHIAVNPANPANVVAGANDYRDGEGGSGFYASADGGQTWTDGILPMPPGVDSAGDPVLRFDRDGGSLYYAHLGFESTGALGGCDAQSGVYLSTSQTGGVSWDDGTAVAPNSATVFNDKPWLAVDRSTGIAGKSGNVYMTYTKFAYGSTLDCQTGAATANSPIKLRRSTDGGATFGPEVDVSGSFVTSQGSAVAVAPDGTVVVAFVSFTGCGECIALARSTDGGHGFTRVKVADIKGVEELPAGGGNTFRADAFPAAAVDASGTIYVAWSEKRGGASTTDVWLSSSSNGTGWSAPVRVNQNASGDQFFPGLAASATGQVFAGYLDRRDDTSNVKFRQYVSHSHDGGATWSDTMVASAPSDPNAQLFEGERFVGDYNGIDVLPDGSGVWTSWVDTRGGDQDAYAARVSFAGSPTSLTATVNPVIGVWGTAFTVSGRLTNGDAGVSSKQVTIQQRPFGASAWTTAAQTVTNGNGDYAVNAGKPGKHTQYRAIFSGSDGLLASLSSPVTAQVRVGIPFGVADSTLSPGQSAVLSGKVLPGHSGKKVLLQQLTNSGWVTIQTVTLDGTSSFRASARLTVGGFRLYRAAYPTQDSDHTWNISRNIGVTWS